MAKKTSNITVNGQHHGFRCDSTYPTKGASMIEAVVLNRHKIAPLIAVTAEATNKYISYA